MCCSLWLNIVLYLLSVILWIYFQLIVCENVYLKNWWCDLMVWLFLYIVQMYLLVVFIECLFVWNVDDLVCGLWLGQNMFLDSVCCVLWVFVVIGYVCRVCVFLCVVLLDLVVYGCWLLFIVVGCYLFCLVCGMCFFSCWS